MKLLLIGASGFLGSILHPLLAEEHDVVGTYATRPVPGLLPLDVTDVGAVQDIVSEPWDAVVHLGGIARAEVCEREPEHAYRVNVGGARNVARAAHGKVVYLSSDNVFDRPGGCVESTPVNPPNHYGELKVAAEHEVLRASGDNVVLRVPFLYGASPTARQFIDRFSGARTAVPHQVVCNPLYAPDLARRMTAVLSASGVVHLGGGTAVTRIDFMERVRSAVPGLQGTTLVPTSLSELPVPRPASSVLCSERDAVAPGRGLDEGIAMLCRDVERLAS